MRRLLLAVLLFAQAPASSPQPGSYPFSYFVNNGEDGLHLLSIARGPDGVFHLVWTTGWWDKGSGSRTRRT